ncbi:hypothetical protein N7452_000319 [Penicillium brevicompactum]|uniref:DUF1754-domain-containing protein n=1 Tax=Penicillium brevicompactum TaxID=5074 RepID=A0A9W9R1U0_PENBR|nr:hypothetical protein N7452_000319 [Penicillium brevicompactum]
MAGDEYSIGGGKLKLKGSKVSGGRIEKKKKKSTKKKEEKVESDANAKADADANTETGLKKRGEKDEEVKSGEEREWDNPGKTETERKYEEIRRKRLHERLQRDGVKTHKERVEDLNKYLSRLSEHHDMYVFLLLGIGMVC